MAGFLEQLRSVLTPTPVAMTEVEPVTDAAVPGNPGDVRYQMLSRQIGHDVSPLTRRSMVDSLAAMPPERAKHTSQIKTAALPPGLLGRTDGSVVTMDPVQAQAGPGGGTVLGHEMTHAQENATWPMVKRLAATMDQGGRRVAGLFTDPQTAMNLEQGGMAESGAYGSEAETYRRGLELLKQRALAARMGRR